MGFLKPKAPKPAPVPTLDPAVTQQTVQEDTEDAKSKNIRKTKEGKSSLTVPLKSTTSGLNTSTSKGSGLSVTKK